MNTEEYNRLRDDAARRAQVLRQQAVHAFWEAVLRRFRHLAHLEA
jgi:hypothetical protein